MDNETTVAVEEKAVAEVKPKRTRAAKPQPNLAKELRELKKEHEELKQQYDCVEDSYNELYNEYKRVCEKNNEQNNLHALKIKTVMDSLENLKRMLVIAEAGGN